LKIPTYRFEVWSHKVNDADVLEAGVVNQVLLLTKAKLPLCNLII
jgi:hypothetical protein